MSEFPSEWSEPFIVPIERGKVREIARAAGSTNPDYLDDPRPPVPPAFFYAASYLWGMTWERPGTSALARAPVDVTALLHAEEEVELNGPPPRAGTELTGRVRLESIEDKQSRSSGATLRFIRATVEYRDSAGSLVATARTTAVEERA